MDVPDLRSSIAPIIAVDLSPIYEAIDRWSWLLNEQYVGYRPGYDELEHDPLCNLSPTYQAGKTAEDIERYKSWGCDRGCLKAWKERTYLLAIRLAG